MKIKKNKEKSGIKIRVLTNLALGFLVLSVGAICLAPPKTTQTEGKSDEIYRFGSEKSQGVSLMFNVYWGTQEVYDILEILKRYDAKATFFIGGCWADDNVDCLREIYTQGHEIGNHGYFHKDHKKLSAQQNFEEITNCNQFIKLTLGVEPALFAPPSGSYGNATLSACETLRMKTVLWSRDTIDWRDKNSALIYTRATKEIKAGEFVLMHPMAETVSALEDILKFYQTQSLKAITVSENIQIENKG
ncbi:MAG: polysaccharide deacetylase [Clostridiales bacterium]|nr:polysaccharide deacetylase [Clostridiales bacterium]